MLTFEYSLLFRARQYGARYSNAVPHGRPELLRCSLIYVERRASRPQRYLRSNCTEEQTEFLSRASDEAEGSECHARETPTRPLRPY
jgi:hypothetical protein